MKKTYKSLLLLSYMSLLPLGQVAHAGCGAHDHNCFHGVYPNDPTLGNIPRGDTTLDITTTYDNASGTADVNQHVALPEDRGPFVASGSEGIPVTQTPVGNGANVIYHDQQVVQYAEGSSGGQLTSTEGQERTTMIGNVASGTYQVGLHNYDIEESGEDANFNTTITAGGRGYFGGRSGSHIATAFDQEITLNGALGADGVTTANFEYTNAGFDPHAQGIYLIPSSTWNIGGIPTDSPIIRHFEFLDPMSQDGAAFDFMAHLNPLSQAAGIEFGGWMYDAGSGRYGFSLSTGDAGSVDISHPDYALSNAGRGLNDISATWHTQIDNNRFSGQDLFVNSSFKVDGYLSGPTGRVNVVRHEDIQIHDVGLSKPVAIAQTSEGLEVGYVESADNPTLLLEEGIGDPGYCDSIFGEADAGTCGGIDENGDGITDGFEHLTADQLNDIAEYEEPFIETTYFPISNYLDVLNSRKFQTIFRYLEKNPGLGASFRFSGVQVSLTPIEVRGKIVGVAVKIIGRALKWVGEKLFKNPKPRQTKPTIAPKPTDNQLNKFRDQLKTHGRAAVERSKRKIERRLQEHRDKLEKIRADGGHTSSVEREIRNFERELQAIEIILGGG